MRTTRDEYNEYLRSDKWTVLAAAVRNERGNRCEFCRIKAGFAVLHCHHMTYERFGNEKKSDLMVLCEFHHSVYHQQFPARVMPRMPEAQLRDHVFEVLRKGPKSPRDSAKWENRKRKTTKQSSDTWKSDGETKILKSAGVLANRVSDHSAALADLRRRQGLKSTSGAEAIKRREERDERKRLKKLRRKKQRSI